MLKRAFLGPVVLVLLAACGASAQTCPLQGTPSPKLVCLIPQVYGPYGLVGGLGTGVPQSASDLFTGDFHAAHFQNSFLTTFAPINEAVGLQVSQLPTASPSSGITFVYDPALKTFAPSTDESLGPILGDRATTIGKHKLFLGFSFQYFNFTSIDGQNMNDIPAVLAHEPFASSATLPACLNQTGLTGQYAGNPCFVRDIIQTTNSISLKVHQYTIYATYGITRHLDFSVAIPILDVGMGITSQATIVPESVAVASVAGCTTPGSGTPTGPVWHSFNAGPGATSPSCSSVNTPNPLLAASCVTQNPCLNATFSNSGSAMGIGDVVLRGKYTVYDGERFAVAGGVDVRLPSGDELDFLGSGATGVKPFGVVSYRARVSPHAEVGYEWNESSTLAGNNLVPQPSGSTVQVVNEARLPDRFTYIVGADVRIVNRLTGAFDIYGQRLFNSPELVSQPFTDFGSCSGPTNSTGSLCTTYTNPTSHPNFATITTGVNIADASIGLKFRAFGRLVITGNVLLKLDNGGLRSKAVPLVGASYNF